MGTVEFGYGEKIFVNADVYSYRVLLLEMVTTKSPTDGLPVGFNSLAEWVRWCLQDEQFPEIIVAEVIDPALLEAMNRESTEAAADSIMEEIIAVLRLGVVCCRNDPKERPPMSAVVDMLRNIKKTKHNNGDVNAIFNVSATTTAKKYNSNSYVFTINHLYYETRTRHSSCFSLS